MDGKTLAFSKEIIVSFEDVSKVIMAEQALLANTFPVKIVFLPSSVRKECGFCLSIAPEDFERALVFLSEQGFTVAEAYIGEEKEGVASYEKIAI